MIRLNPFFYSILIILMIINFNYPQENKQAFNKIGKFLSAELELDPEFNIYKKSKGIYILHSLVKNNVTTHLNVRDKILNSEKRKVLREKADFSGRYVSPEVIILPELEFYEIINPIVEYYILNNNFPFKDEINIDSLRILIKMQIEKK